MPATPDRRTPPLRQVNSGVRCYQATLHHLATSTSTSRPNLPEPPSTFDASVRPSLPLPPPYYSRLYLGDFLRSVRQGVCIGGRVTTHRPSFPEYLEGRSWCSSSVRRHDDVTSYLKTPRTYDAHVNGVSDYAESARNGGGNFTRSPDNARTSRAEFFGSTPIEHRKLGFYEIEREDFG